MIVPTSQENPGEGQELQQEELQDDLGMGAHDQAARYASGNPAEQVSKDWDISRQLDIPYSPDFERAALEEEARYRKMVQDMQAPSVWDHVPTNKWLQAPENLALSQNELPAMAGVGSARDRALAADKARVDLANRAGRVNAWLSPIVSLGRGAVELASLPGDILHLLDNFQRKMVGLPGRVAPKDSLSSAKEYLKSKEIATADLFVSDPVTGESFFNPDALSISNAAKLLAGETPSMAAMIGLTALTGGAGAPAAAVKYSPWLAKAYNLGKYMLKPAAVINSARVAQGVYEGGIDYLMGKGQTREQAEANAAPGAILAGVGSTFLGSPMEARIIESWASSMVKQPSTATLGRRVLTMLKQFPIQGTKEAAQEVLEGIGEDTAKWLTFQPDLTIKQAAQNMVGNALGGLVVGGAFGAALHAPIALQMGARTQYFEELRARIQNSKMPEDKLIESIKVQAEGGPDLPTVDARVLGTLWQGLGEDPNQKAADLEIEGFLPALASGQEVQLSPKAFVQMAKDETLDAIQEDLRVSPGAATAREDALYQKDAERIKKQVSEGKAPDEAIDPDFAEVKEFYRSRLIAAGRPVDVAETESLLAAAALTNVTRREGLSPKWALETYMPEITRPSLGEQGALIDRAMGRIQPQPTAEESSEVEPGMPETPEGMGWWETYFQGMNEKPVFYSALGRSIPEISKIADKDGNIAADQVKTWLAARQKEGKFKQAELDAIGLPEWLELQKGKVNTKDIQDFVENNGVKTQEILKGQTWSIENSFGETEYYSTKEEAEKSYYDEVDYIKKHTYSLQDFSDDTVNPRIYTLNENGYITQIAELNDKGEWQGKDEYTGREWTYRDKEDVINSMKELITININDLIKRMHKPELNNNSQDAKFEDRTIPGGENYKELLLTLPGDKKFSSSHFDEKNILAHVRFNERTDSEGKKVLFIEEIQSDWGQKGKKEGFDEVPKAPFVTDTKAWLDLSIKRMMRYAVDNRFDKIAFINGDQSADRYDLRRFIEAINYTEGDGVYFIDVYDKYGDTIKEVSKNMDLKEIEDTFGKEIALKIKSSEGQIIENVPIKKSISGENLAVGGKGMKTFYDVIVPSVAKETARKLGGKLGQSTIDFDGDTSKQVSIEITPEMAKTIQEGLPLFQRGGGRYSSAKEKLAARMRKLAASRPQALLKAMEETFKEEAEAFAAFEEQIKPVQAGDILAGKRTGKKKGAEEPLGFFQYLDYGDGKKSQLGFLEKADLTTFLHEHTHFLMRIMRDLASRPEASEQIKADWQALKEYAGAKGDKLTPKQEEKLAEAGEKYLMEGKAPSMALRSAFQRVKRWFQLIYEVLGRTLNVKLSVEVRSVFDRIYATDQEIEEARGLAGDGPLLRSPEETGMTPEAHKRYLKIAQQEIDDANEKLDRAKLREVTKERRDFLEAERERIRPQVEALVDQEPVYRAIDALSDGELPNGQKIKLYKPALVEKYGEGAVKDLPRSVKFGYKIAGEGSVDADGAAELLGYSNGQALLDALRMAEPKEAYINRLVDERVKALHGDPLDPAALAEAAQAAIHDSRPERMMIEARELRRAQRMAAPAVKLAEQEGEAKLRAEREAGQAAVQREKTRRQTEDFWLKGVAAEVPPMRTFQEAAKEILAGVRLIDINPNKYLQAQRKFSGEAFRALANKDYETAADAKEKELLNHFLYREAKKWKDFEGKVDDYVRKLMKPAAQRRIAKAGGDEGEKVYLAQIYGILEQFQWTRETNIFLETRALIREDIGKYLEDKIKAGELPDIDPLILSGEIKNYRELTGPELEAVYDGLKVIEEAAQRESKVITEEKQVEKEQALAELKDSAYGQFKIKPALRDKNTRSKIDRAVRFVKMLDAGMIKFEQWVDRLDGGDINGPWRRYIFEPAAMAQYEEYRLTHEITGRLAEAMAGMPKEVMKNLDDKIEVPGLGTVTRRWIISAALNAGNESNYQKLLKGEGLADFGGPELLGKAFDQLTKPEWVFVQNLWDLLETLKPEIEALELRYNGIAPKWVEVRPFEVNLPDGEVLKLKGGYWPVMYDPEESLAGRRQEDAVFDEAKRQVFWPTTFTGYTKKRVEDFSRRMILDFETVLGRHLPKVIKDLSHREAVTSIARLLGNEGLQTTLNETIGVEYAKEFWPWLLNLVNDNAGVNSPSARTFEWVMNGLRTNLVAGTLGFRASSVAAQATDFARVMVGDHAVSPMFMGRSLAKFMAEFSQYALTGGAAGFPMLDVMREMSPEMRGRAENLDRDIRAYLKRLTLQEGEIARLQRWGFKGLAVADAVTSTITWWAAFNQATAKGADTKQAVKEADRVVRLKLMTGAPKDQVALQANGSQLVKFMTMFMGDAVNTYGIARQAFENIADRKKLASSVFALAVVGFVAPILADIIKNKIPEDDEEKRRYLAGKLIFGLPQSLPFVRDVAGALEDGYTYKYTPVQTSIEKTIKAARMGRDLLGDEKDVEWDDFFMSGLEAGGYLFGVPGAGQVGTSYRYLENIEKGKIDRPDSDAQHIRNLLFGPPPKPKGGR